MDDLILNMQDFVEQLGMLVNGYSDKIPAIVISDRLRELSLLMEKKAAMQLKEAKDKEVKSDV